MALRPIGWICGEMVRKFAGQAEIIQRATLEIIDEIRDEFPNLLRLTSSNQNSTLFFYDVISYPAKTALTSAMCVSYAALIFLAISINKILGKIKNIVEAEKVSRESSSDNVDADGFHRANEAARCNATNPTQQGSSEFIIKAPKKGGSIQTLLSAIDQEN
ncbi:hypothetical protein JD844_008815 [Phrynosoma platyrhinos]|uniref:Spermatogenesis-associated protein 9 n=1 Tax=Phrynosoma platyrhinos TaxID=52577 RepID=A0ABQ7TEC5_PHRPL|nr:hypothetical protein JD844_008815 [Phrynosoma platyrhinos]